MGCLIFPLTEHHWTIITMPLIRYLLFIIHIIVKSGKWKISLGNWFLVRRNHLQSFSCSSFLWPWDHDWNSTAIFQPSLFTLVRKISRCTSISILALDTYQGELVVVVERPNLSWRKGIKENSKKGENKRERKNGRPCEVFETVSRGFKFHKGLEPSAPIKYYQSKRYTCSSVKLCRCLAHCL